VEAVHRLITDDYIQHNPMVKTGKEGLLETLHMLKNLPKDVQNKSSEVCMIAEHDLVATHFKVAFAGQQKLVTEIFRIENGLIAEHWDAIQDMSDCAWAEVAIAGNALADTDLLTSTNNQAQIQQLYEVVLLPQQYQNLEQFLDSDVTLHTPLPVQGIDGWVKHQQKCKIDKVHRVISEGNMVVVQSSGVLGNAPHVVYAVFQLSKLKVVNHWLTVQPIPQQMMHTNGMI
jgi:predicted SnoaL-like aldol condensation-catalyzing enzyme